MATETKKEPGSGGNHGQTRPQEADDNLTSSLHFNQTASDGQATIEQTAVTRQEARRLLNGDPPSAAELTEYGPWSPQIRALHEAYDQGGTDAVRTTWQEITKAQPELIGLVAEGSHSDPARWQVFTLADAYKPRPPLQYVIEDLFLLPSLSIIYGAPGTFKTFVMADAAMCVAAGLPWLEPSPGASGVTARQTLQKPVLWADFDNGARRSHERMAALARVRELPADTPFFYVAMPTPWLDAGNPDSMAMLTDHVWQYCAKLVVIDNLGTVAGTADENSAAMVQVLAVFRQLAERTGAAVVLIHHQRKTASIRARAGETLRGHSSIEAALDLALLVEREERASTIQLKSTKVRGVDVWPFGAVFTYEHQAGTTELHTARFSGVQVEDVASDMSVMQAVLKLVSEHPGILKGELKKQSKTTLLDVGLNRIGNIVDKLVGQGSLVMEAGERGAKQYYVPASQSHDDLQEAP